MLSKETIKNMDRILLRALYNGGMIDRKHLQGMFGPNKTPYENKQVRLLRENNLAEIYYGYTPHVIYIKLGGLTYLYQKYQEI